MLRVIQQFKTFRPLIFQLSLSRNLSFLVGRSGQELRISMAGEKDLGAKRHGGKRGGFRKTIDLNKGTRLGDGKLGSQWVGLTARTDFTRPRLPSLVAAAQAAAEDESGLRKSALPSRRLSPLLAGMLAPERGEMDKLRQKRILELRLRSVLKRRRFNDPLMRGWTSRSAGGVSLGPPDPRDGLTFESFDSRTIELRRVSHMSPTQSRVYRQQALVAVGNGRGLCGIGSSRALLQRSALTSARNKAARRLHYFELCDGRTIFHNAFVQHLATRIYAYPAPPGHGLVCHRVIQELCTLIGIKDIYVKLEGSTRNYRAVIKGFFTILRQQMTPQEIADKHNLHLVETRPETDYYPRILASPRQPLLAGALAAAASSLTAPVPAPAALSLTAKSRFLLATASAFSASSATSTTSSSSASPAKLTGASVTQTKSASGGKSRSPFEDAPPEARVYRSSSVFDEQSKSKRQQQKGGARQPVAVVAGAKEKETLKSRPVFVNPLQTVSVPCASRQVHPDEMLNLEALNWGGGRMPRPHRSPVPFFVHTPSWQRHLARELPRRNWERVRAERAVASALHGVPDIPPLAESFHEDRLLVELPLPHNSYLKLLSDISKKEKEKENEQSAKAA